MSLSIGLVVLILLLVGTTKISAKEVRSSVVLILTALILFWVVANSFTSVPVGSTAVAVLFENVRTDVYTEGVHLVNPFLDFSTMSVRRQIIEFHSAAAENGSAGTEVSLSSNNVPMTIDVTYAFQLNPRYAWWVYRHMGLDEAYRTALISQAARSATRAAAAQFSSDEATTSKRGEFTQAIEVQFSTHLIADLVRQGLSMDEAKEVFIVLPVQLRKVLPPEKVLNAIAEKASAEQDLQRQVTLTNIAEQEAERRSNEGKGVRNLFAKLPRGFTAEQISLVVTALANKTKADALMKGIETGKVNLMVMDGGTPSIQANLK